MLLSTPGLSPGSGLGAALRITIPPAYSVSVQSIVILRNLLSFYHDLATLNFLTLLLFNGISKEVLNEFKDLGILNRGKFLRVSNPI